MIPYTSGSQMGVRVPLGVREGTPGGTWYFLKIYLKLASIQKSFKNSYLINIQ